MPTDIFALFFLATFVEGTVKFLFSTDDNAPTTKADKFKASIKPYLGYIALFIGIIVAISYKVNIPAMFGLGSDWHIVDYIVSGVAIGRGSNYLNDLISSTRAKMSGQTTVTTTAPKSAVTTTTVEPATPTK